MFILIESYGFVSILLLFLMLVPKYKYRQNITSKISFLKSKADNSSQMLLAHLKGEEMLFWFSLTALMLKTVVISNQCFTINRLIKWNIFHCNVRNSSYIFPAGVCFLSHISGSLGNLEEM